MSANLVTVSFVVALLGSTALRLWLNHRQLQHVALHRNNVPTAFATTVSLAAHQKAAAYTLAKGQFQLFSLLVGGMLIVAWTLLGGLQLLTQGIGAGVAPSAWAGYGQGLALLGGFALISALLDLPLEAAQTFRLEARFGFNRTSWGLWLGDHFKGLLVTLVLGLPLAWAVLALMRHAGSLWWVWAWGLWLAFSLTMMVLLPLVIAPLFNRFTPLTDATLKARIEGLFQRVGLSTSGLFVMDAGRRSAHSNAYFTGLGHAKRVVLFDTLLDRLTAEETEAVLAHELGHFKLRHVPKRLVSMAIISLVGFGLLGWLSEQPAFYLGLGVHPNWMGGHEALALLLFLLVLPTLTFPLTPLMAWASRRHEFEADAFACQHANGRALVSALLKLHEDNASTLTPDPLVARWTYSHPPAAERIPAIEAQL
ncbi:M48 family metallopeptidase [Inhella gelatinilytica]|uniref:M48 family metallopeptidase n=1 Tax=Inhella gelatinilytica TaxID=2795030 RepID=A0A931J0Y4_9BURK|nr:M48 family metallopeptidase [Inhella gelatinilytica]MBH9554143.1 M48 family metallopeptidase [Inhella gelatinilytica]